MAIGWVVRKVMGKRDEAPGQGPSSPEDGSSGSGENNRHCCCQKSHLRWIITLVLSLQLLVFLLVSLPLWGGRHGHHPIIPIQAPIMFMFKLQRSASVIRSYKAELESNLSSHIHARNMKVSLYSVKQEPDSDWAEVRFQLLPEHTNSTYDVKLLRGNLVKFFLRERNLSLTPTTFGKVFDFQINRLQGGVTIVPDKSLKSLSKRSALFNFTLNNASISTVSAHLDDFRSQLFSGLCLRSHELLVLRLTNLNGSTVESPVIVQNLVFREHRQHLLHTRLKQLAKHVARHRKNLGVNMSMYGRVEDVELAPVLQHFLEHHGPAPAPAPGPFSAPGFSHYHSVSYPGVAPSPSAIQVGFAGGPISLPPVSSENVAPQQQQQGFAPVPAPQNSGARRSGGVSLWVVVFGLVASVCLLWVTEKPG